MPGDTVSQGPVQRSSLVDGVVERIKELVVHGKLKPGDMLPSERTLMVQLGVGRTSIREAIKALAMVGVLDVRQGRGTFVSQGVSPSTFQSLSWAILLERRNQLELVEARTILEVELAYLASQRRTEGDLASLQAALNDMAASLKDVPGFVRADVEFHITIASMAQNRILLRTLDAVRGLLTELQTKVATDEAMRVRSLQYHRGIYQGILLKDGERTRQAMRDHISDVYRTLLSIYSCVQAVDEPQGHHTGNVQAAPER